MNIFGHQRPGDHAVISQQAWGVLRDQLSAEEDSAVLNQVHKRLITFESAHHLSGKLLVEGSHQLENSGTALAVGELLGLAADSIEQELKSFRGLPHRLEFVRKHKDVSYYNDSKSTMPEAMITALQAFDRRIVLLVGGSDKQVSWDAPVEIICQRARAVIAFGEAQYRITTAIRQLGEREDLPSIESVHKFSEGIELARRLAAPGETVLLSPGCPSYDEFANYEQRGDQFKAVVNRWS